MATSCTTWLKGCGIGCGLALLVLVAISVGGSTVLMSSFREAVEMRETLDERHGDVNDFVPWPDGSIPPDRLEAFLRVRGAVQENCAEFGAREKGFEALDRLDDRGEPSAREVLGAFGESSKSLFALGPILGGFFRTRNAALLEADMGLGEYTFIYASAYGPTLAGRAMDQAGESGAEAGSEEAHLSKRVRETLRQQLRNRLIAMEQQHERWEGTEEHRLLAEEMATLEEHAGRLPWQSQRPPALEASLAPYEEQLAALFCPEASHLELQRHRTRGIGIQGD